MFTSKKDRIVIPWESVEHRFKRISGSNFRTNRNGKIIDISKIHAIHYRKEAIDDILSCCPGMDEGELFNKYLLMLEFYYLNPYTVTEMCVYIRVDFCDGTYEDVDEAVPLMMDPHNLFYLTEVPMNRKAFFTGRGAVLIFDSLEELQNIESISCYWYGLYPDKKRVAEADGLLTKIQINTEFSEVSGSRIYRARGFAMPYGRLLPNGEVHPDFEKMVPPVPSLEMYDKALSMLCVKDNTEKENPVYEFYKRENTECKIEDVGSIYTVMSDIVYDVFEDKNLFGTRGYLGIDEYELTTVITDDVYDRPYMEEERYTEEELINIRPQRFSVWEESILDNQAVLQVSEEEIIEEGNLYE